MIAVAKIGGHQAIVKVGDKLEVDKLHVEVGKTAKFETLLISEEDGSGFQIGAPTLDASVEAKVLEHGRGKKIKVFKMKPRKRYRRTIGHRQDYTLIEITKIGGKAAAKPKAAKKEDEKKTSKPAAKKAAPPKKAAPKKAAAKADDLKKIEGIGPKIAGLLNDAGIMTFADLAKAKKADLTAILEKAGARYKTHDPTTWPKQSKLAADGKWDELQKLQDELMGGKA